MKPFEPFIGNGAAASRLRNGDVIELRTNAQLREEIARLQRKLFWRQLATGLLGVLLLVQSVIYRGWWWAR